MKLKTSTVIEKVLLKLIPVILKRINYDYYSYRNLLENIDRKEVDKITIRVLSRMGMKKEKSDFYNFKLQYVYRGIRKEFNKNSHFVIFKQDWVKD